MRAGSSRKQGSSCRSGSWECELQSHPRLPSPLARCFRVQSRYGSAWRAAAQGRTGGLLSDAITRRSQPSDFSTAITRSGRKGRYDGCRGATSAVGISSSTKRRQSNFISRSSVCPSGWISNTRPSPENTDGYETQLHHVPGRDRSEPITHPGDSSD